MVTETEPAQTGLGGHRPAGRYAHLVSVFWTLLDGVSRLALALIVSVIVARTYGPAAFGAISFAFAAVALMQPFVSVGGDQIAIRELSTDGVDAPGPLDRRHLIGTTAAMRLVGALVAIGATYPIAHLAGSGPRNTVTLTVIISLSLLFMTFDPIDFNFRSVGRAGLGARARVAGSLIGTALRIVVIANHESLLWVAATYLVDASVPACVLLVRFGWSALTTLRFSPAVVRMYLKDSWPLLFSALSVVLYLRIDQVMLTSMKGVAENAVYSAAVRVSEVANFVPGAIMVALGPVLLRARSDPADYEAKKAAITRVFAGLGIVVGLVVAALAHPVISILFGPRFGRSATMLEILSIAPVFVFLGVIQAYCNIAENRQVLNMYTVIVGAAVNVVLNVVLIPKYGGIGTSVATVVAYGVASTWVYWFIPGHRGVPAFHLGQALQALRNPVRALRTFVHMTRTS